MKASEFFFCDKRITRVGLLGLGKSNLSVYNYLLGHYPNLHFTLRLYTPTEKIPSRNIDRVMLGENMLLDIDEEILFLSPSASRSQPEIVFAKERGVILSSDCELFFERSKHDTLAVTGSDGKSTTVSLSERILLDSGLDALAIGNIGEAMTRHIDDSPGRIMVAELSSFQLEHMTPKLKRALITNITPNHLDRHITFEAYLKAKMNITKSAEEIIYNYDCEASRNSLSEIYPYAVFSKNLSYCELKDSIKAENYFNLEGSLILKNGDRILDFQNANLKGEHNAYNVMAALAISNGYADDKSSALSALRFKGLSHRAELISIIDGVSYIDSSIDSTPKRTKSTLLMIKRPLILLLGGRSKGLDFSELCEPIIKRARLVIISGENRHEIFSALSDSLFGKVDILLADTLFDAVEIAKKAARAGDTVLLSPASTSYDAFKNFEERGAEFSRYVKNLK